MIVSPGGTGPTSASASGSVTTQPWAMNVRRSVRSVANSVGDWPSWDQGSLPRKRARTSVSIQEIAEIVRDRVCGGPCRQTGPCAGEPLTAERDRSESPQVDGLDRPYAAS